MILAFILSIDSIFSKVVEVLFMLILKISNIILSPLYLLLSSLIPNIDDSLEWVSQFFTTLSNYGRFVITWTGLYSEVVSILVLIWVAIISIPVAALGIKKAIQWYNAFKF